MIKSVPYHPNSLTTSAMNFLHGFPRRGASNQLGRVDVSEFNGTDGANFLVWWADTSVTGDAATYFSGINGSSVAMAMTFCFLSLLGCGTFGFLRGGCDTCGKRQPTVKYTTKDVNVTRGLLLYVVIVTFILFGLSLNAASGVSSTAIHAFDKTHEFVNYGWQLMDPLQQLATQTATGLANAQYLQDALNASLPNPNSSIALQQVRDTTNHLRIASTQLNYQVQRLFDRRAEYDQKRFDAWSTADQYDMNRLILMYIAVSLPPALAVLASLGAIVGRGCPAMIMGLAYPGIMAFFFFAASAQLPLATVAVDHCANTTQWLSYQFADNVFSPAEWEEMSGIPVTQNVTVSEVFDYFTLCDSPTPEFMTVVANYPTTMVTPKGFDYAQIKLQAQQDALPGSLSANISATFDSLAAQVTAAGNLANNAMTTYLTCQSVRGRYNVVFDAVCADTGFAGAIALSVSLLMFFPLCMIPGVVAGVRGYKQFNPLHHQNPQQQQQNKRQVAPDERKQQKRAQQEARRQGQAHRVAHGGEGAVAYDPQIEGQVAGLQELWSCPNCTYMNNPRADVCQMCFLKRQKPRGQSQQVHQAQQYHPQHPQHQQHQQHQQEGFVIPAGENAVIVPVDY